MNKNTRPEVKARSEYSSQLEYQKAKKAQLEWDIAQQENRIKAKQNKVITKQKILIGSYYLNEMANNPELKSKIFEKLDKFLTRKADREVFGFNTTNESISG